MRHWSPTARPMDPDQRAQRRRTFAAWDLGKLKSRTKALSGSCLRPYVHQRPAWSDQQVGLSEEATDEVTNLPGADVETGA